MMNAYFLMAQQMRTLLRILKKNIYFINNVKKGTFHEHSPILHSLTNLIGWGKVCSGLVKMFQGEVLFKYPVIQHTYFGTIVEFQ
ncbi:unnamed protein product [Paramecium pentaurelia]|uniref:Serine/threonine-protein phosphatase 2A activator n=1 Tax=Paramecium pentaurelia TaxID=43138 RepID=A0A8S1SSJ9_9CILI|nr:unnamed protein product [Paramecium pentaurelia]